MKTMPESSQTSNHWLENRNSSKILNPSNSTDLGNRQNSSASPYAKTLGSKPLLNCLCAAETNGHVSNPSNSMGLKLKQKPPRTGLAAGKRHIPFSNWNALRTELSWIHSSSLSLRGGLQPDEAYAKGISPALRLISLAKRLLRRYAPRNDVFKTFPEPLVREISLTKNPLNISSQEAEAYRHQLPSSEAIAESLRTWASYDGTATVDDQLEVEA